MTNYAKQIAEMLGLKIGEKFKIKGHPDMGTFWFVEDDSCGLRDLWQYEAGPEMHELDYEPEWLLEQLLAGFYEVEKKPWKPKEGDTYFMPVEPSQAMTFAWNELSSDLARWKSGLCFKTKDEALTLGVKRLEELQKEYEKSHEPR